MIKQIKRIVLILASAMILAVSVNMFLSPQHVAAGGVSGLGVLMETTLKIDRSIVVLVVNLIMLVLAALFLGKKVFLNTILGALAFPFFLGVIPEMMVISDRLVSVIFGSIIWAIGVAILYNLQATVGGTTIPPLILEKYFNMSTSIGLLISDAVIVCLSLYVFGLESFFFAVLSIGITSIAMTYIETGLNKKKALMIVTTMDHKEFKQQLNEEVPHDIVIFTVQSGEENVRDTMKLMVVSESEYPMIKEAISKIDPKAYIMAYNVAEVSDFGLTYHPFE